MTTRILSRLSGQAAYLRRARCRYQRGVYALEFAIVFPVFFMVFYAILSYGMIFMLRLGFQHAAEEGARAALRYQVTAAGVSQLPSRMNKAITITNANLAWFTRPFAVTAKICQSGSDTVCSDAATPPSCGTNIAGGCQIVVTVTYAYGANPLVPALPGFNLLTPTTLTGRAAMLLDGRALSAT